MRAENRHFTFKWKLKRKNHEGDKCHLAKCGLCSWWKRLGNSSHAKTKLQASANEKFKQELDELSGD